MRKKYKHVNVEEEHQDVLMNMEMAMLSVYRENRSLRDFDFEVVVNETIRYYSAKQKNKTVTQKPLNDDRQKISDNLQRICDLMLNDFQGLTTEDGTPVAPPVENYTTVEIVLACLKRIRKSIQRWGKRNGPKGYVTFIDEFMDGKYTS